MSDQTMGAEPVESPLVTQEKKTQREQAASSKWKPVVELLEKMSRDEQLMADWARDRRGHIESPALLDAAISLQRKELASLMRAVSKRLYE